MNKIQTKTEKIKKIRKKNCNRILLCATSTAAPSNLLCRQQLSHIASALGRPDGYTLSTFTAFSIHELTVIHLLRHNFDFQTLHVCHAAAATMAMQRKIDTRISIFVIEILMSNLLFEIGFRSLTQPVQWSIVRKWRD